jgi:alanine racemase
MAYIKIYKQHLYYNFNEIVKKVGSIEKIALVLKDNAYGHGLTIIATLASEYGIKHAIVKNLDEAIEVESFFDTILILGDKIIRHKKFYFAINSLDSILSAEEGAKVELKIDTGMHRNGIAVRDFREAIKLIQLKELQLVGVMTHYKSADVLSSEYFWQSKQFEIIKNNIKELKLPNVRIHSHNSAALLRTNTINEDLYRIGIAAYGYNELPNSFEGISLKPVLSLHATRVSTRKIKKGECIGYGGSYIASKSMMVSTYNLGYGDGWFRGDSNSPYVTSEDLCILGRVSMDFMTFASEKEELCIMNDCLAAAKQYHTISYEMTTSLNSKLRKVVIED